MCGLGGILRTDGGSIPEAWIDAIDQRIAYRGPDGEGRFRDRVESDTAVELALVHRRLSIIDHAGGSQPMVSTTGRTDDDDLVAVVFNGCIYNHRELRAELHHAGHRFVTDHADTEVLLHGYREWGDDLAEHLHGMYAFAIWDRARTRLMLARDWFGQKPLYVRRGLGPHSGVLLFASDARAIATIDDALPAGAVEPMREWTARYLQLGYNWRGATVYDATPPGATPPVPGVVQLPPTIIGRIDALHGEADPPDLERLETLLNTAVQRRLEADVPLGCFLSGGIDSALVAHFAQQHQPDVRTFCMRMPDDRYDESDAAAEVAAHIGTQHTTLDVAPDPATDLVHLVHTMGQPFGDSSILPTYWVSRAAREHVKVALTGDGGDEMFIGYERYLAARRLHMWRRLCSRIPSGLLRRGAHPKSKRDKLGRLGDMARCFPKFGVLALEHVFTAKQIRGLLGLPDPDPAHWPAGRDALRALREIDLQSYLVDDLMTKVDVASMAVALEVRCPMLDRDLATRIIGTRVDDLVPGKQRKGLLRNLARRLLPPEFVDRPKMGFAIPIGEWFRSDHGGMRTLLEDHLGSAEPFGSLPIRVGVARELMEQHQAGRIDHGQRLFALLTLSIWARTGRRSP